MVICSLPGSTGHDWTYAWMAAISSFRAALTVIAMCQQVLNVIVHVGTVTDQGGVS